MPTTIPSLDVQVRDGIARVRLQRPERLNAIDEELADGLSRTLGQLRNDPAARVVVLSGAGDAFCAGSDVVAMRGRPLRHDLPPAERRRARVVERDRLTRAFGNAVQLWELPKPTIAAVNGVAAGAGLALAVACDFRVVARTSRFLAAYGRLGLPGDWGLTRLLPELVGLGVTRRMLLRGTPVTAAEAVEVGLADELVDDADVDGRVAELAAELATTAPVAVAEAKALLRRVDLRPVVAAEVEATLRCQETTDHAEGLAALAARREPSFSGT